MGLSLVGLMGVAGFDRCGLVIDVAVVVKLFGS